MDNGFVTTIKVCSTIFFRIEVKLSVPCRKILGMIQNATGMKRDTLYAKFITISHQVSPALLPDVCAGYCQGALVDESLMIRTQMGMHSRPRMVTVLGTSCAIPPHNIRTLTMHVYEMLQVNPHVTYSK
jgi:hypothetical protein